MKTKRRLLTVGLVSGVLGGLFAGSACAGETPIPIKDKETAVFVGDSITIMSGYAKMVETFLISRLPQKELIFYNLGVSGDSAAGGLARWAKDAGPLRPSLVLVDFGMNDGGYAPFSQKTQDGYMESQRGLAAAIKAMGAREILLTTSPKEPETNQKFDYNDTLARFAEGVAELARKQSIPLIDIFHPMRQVMAELKAQNSKVALLLNDRVHPAPAGHLVMAYYVLRSLDIPKGVARIRIGDGTLAESVGCKVERLAVKQGSIEFELKLERIPFYIPPPARPVLDSIPFQSELNACVLQVDDWPSGAECVIRVDGQEVAKVSGADLARGVDLALLDKAPWSRQGQDLWEMAEEKRFWQCYTAFGGFPLGEKSWHADIFAVQSLQKARTKYVEALAEAMRRIAQPGRHHIALAPVLAGETKK